jgi:hypothetical protein
MVHKLSKWDCKFHSSGLVWSHCNRCGHPETDYCRGECEHWITKDGDTRESILTEFVNRKEPGSNMKPFSKRNHHLQKLKCCGKCKHSENGGFPSNPLQCQHPVELRKSIEVGERIEVNPFGVCDGYEEQTNRLIFESGGRKYYCRLAHCHSKTLDVNRCKKCEWFRNIETIPYKLTEIHNPYKGEVI